MKPPVFNHKQYTDLEADYMMLKAENEQLKAELAAAVENLKSALIDGGSDICTYCKNYIKCKGRDCDCYCEGIGGCETKSGNPLPDFEWTCEDFDYGTCDKLQSTPCNGCFENGYSGFEYRGLSKDGE